jgi:ABC-type phosphate transport system substrate-binding protein
MPTKLIAILVAISLAGLAGSCAVAQTFAVAVVVHQKNPIANLSTPELRKLFAGEKRSWAGGLPVKLFIRAAGARERIVVLKLLGMSESEYKQYWIAQVFRGEAQGEPVALFSNGMQKEALATFPGALALVNFQDVKPGMKVVKLDGHLPGEAGYPLN